MPALSFRIAFALLIALATLGPAAAQPLGKKTVAAAHKFAADNSLFVLYHEVGHLLIDQLGLPILGREEDAADNIASWTLLNQDTREAHDALAHAAYGWLLSGIAYAEYVDERSYYGQHSLDKQRAYQIVCLMVGKDERAFRRIANQYGIDRRRQDSCYWDYELVDRSMRNLISSHVNAKTRSGGIKVTYHDATGPLKAAADAFRQSGIFDRVAAEVQEDYPLSRPIAFNARRCGEVNAFYDPNTVEVIFCYELMDEFISLATKEIQTKGSFTFGPSESTRID